MCKDTGYSAKESPFVVVKVRSQINEKADKWVGWWHPMKTFTKIAQLESIIGMGHYLRKIARDGHFMHPVKM